MNADLEIISFKEGYSQQFYALNAAWLEKYFYIEPYDEKVLSKPKKYIIDEGGYIFFAKYKNEIVGVVSLINQKTYFELSKMAVDPKFQGLKIGKSLVKFCIDFAKNKKWDNIILYSHRSLETAIHLYRNMGFVEIPVEENSHYERADIKMILEF
ncbi:GNAT family N-acetyltransferase [Polaribacter sp. P097]|uniref:GNAT family N-acetyltransferase n=1 Tax=Polaribacter sp. P097 TaxID=3117398 RepID=UPI002FE351D9